MQEFVANRLSSGNRMFPDKVKIEDNGITLRTAKLFGGREKTLLYHEIMSVENINPLMGFSTIKFKTNRDIIECSGFTKDQTNQIKQIVSYNISQSRSGGMSYAPPQFSNYQINQQSEQQYELERDRLHHEKNRRKLERADQLRREGRNIHALIVEYDQVFAGALSAVFIFGIVIFFKACQ